MFWFYKSQIIAVGNGTMLTMFVANFYKCLWVYCTDLGREHAENNFFNCVSIILFKQGWLIKEMIFMSKREQNVNIQLDSFANSKDYPLMITQIKNDK